MKEQIEGEKVILRRPVDNDAVYFARWYNEPDIMAKCGFTENTTVENELAIIRRCIERKDRDLIHLPSNFTKKQDLKEKVFRNRGISITMSSVTLL